MRRPRNRLKQDWYSIERESTANQSSCFFRGFSGALSSLWWNNAELKTETKLKRNRKETETGTRQFRNRLKQDPKQYWKRIHWQPISVLLCSFPGTLSRSESALKQRWINAETTVKQRWKNRTDWLAIDSVSELYHICLFQICSCHVSFLFHDSQRCFCFLFVSF